MYVVILPAKIGGTKYKEGQEFDSYYTTQYWFLKAST